MKGDVHAVFLLEEYDFVNFNPFELYMCLYMIFFAMGRIKIDNLKGLLSIFIAHTCTVSPSCDPVL